MPKPLRILLIIVAIAILLALLAGSWARPAPDHPFYAGFNDRPLVIAHRGGRGLWPENTLYAYQHAVDLGVDVLEMDMHMTADGVPVMIHDATVDRTTDGAGGVKDMTLEALKALDAGYNWSPDDGATFPYRGQGITVPTLEEVFQAFPHMPMNIEIKQADPPITDVFCQLIRSYGRQNLVLVASFNDQTLADFRAACPEVATSTAREETRLLVILNLVWLGRFYNPPAHAVQVPEENSGIYIMTERFVRTAHNRNLYVDIWTINETADMQRMIDLGVDGIITDYPDRLLSLLGR